MSGLSSGATVLSNDEFAESAKCLMQLLLQMQETSHWCPWRVNSIKLCEKKISSVSLAGCICLLVLMSKVWPVLRSWLWWSHWKKQGEVGWYQAVAVSTLTAAHNTPPPLHCQVQRRAVPRQGSTLAHQGHAQDTRQCLVWAMLCGDSLSQGWCTPDILFLFSWAVFHRFLFPLTCSVSVPWRERMELTSDRSHLPTDDLWPLTPAEFPILLGLLNSTAPPTAAHIATGQSRGSAGAVTAVWR